MDLSREHRAEEERRAKEHRFLGFWKVVAVFATMGIIGLLLGAEPLHLRAGNLPPSVFRSVAVAVSGPLATASESLELDRPWEWATGYEDLQTDETEVTSSASGFPEELVTGTTVPAPPSSTTTLQSTGGVSTTTTTSRVTSSTTTTTTEPEPVFTAQEPLRILVVGDSLSVMMGYGLLRQAEANPAIKVEMVNKVSSGLSRPDFYNWPKVMTEKVAEYRPHVAVILFGGNDKQPIHVGAQSLPSFSEEWKREYYRRIWGFLDIITASGGEAVWMGLPIMRGEKFSETCRTLNDMYSTICEYHEGATYIDGYSLFMDENGKYNKYLVDSSGERRLMRADDGIHLSNAGGDRQAEAVMEVLLDSYRLEP